MLILHWSFLSGVHSMFMFWCGYCWLSQECTPVSSFSYCVLSQCLHSIVTGTWCCSVFNRIMWFPIPFFFFFFGICRWSWWRLIILLSGSFSQDQYLVLFSVDSYGFAILVLLVVDDHGVTWSSCSNTHRECYTEVHIHQHFNSYIHMCVPTFISI